MRRAYLQVDKFTVWQDWSTFQYVAALPESTDFVGATEGPVFVRQPMIRYSTPPSVSLNLIGSYQSVDYAGPLSAASLARFNKRAWSGAANIFWPPVKTIDVGFEYRHGERKLVSGAKGQLDRFEFAAKYSFWTGEGEGPWPRHMTACPSIIRRRRARSS